MRIVVLILAALAAVKVWASNQMYRAAAEDAVVAAYRDAAIAACQQDAARDGRSATVAQWAKPASIRFMIGKRGIDVNVWDVDNAQWKARYKQAFLVLAPADAATRAACEYDVSAKVAAIVPL